MKTKVLLICIFIAWFQSIYAQVWVSGQGNGRYKNPVLYADYSDPDLIRVGVDYYLTASSFNCVPGLPVLHSKDLINWKIVNYALPELRMEGVEPPHFFDTPQHGKGVWAPCIRYHNGEYLIYWGDPDFGIYVVKTKDILGKWDKPVLVLKGKGRIDPSPLFDDDGRVYLVHAWAGSRAGGVETGWQIALRSKNVYGPYEVKKVLAQGTTSINGPHQGGLVDMPTGEWWFMHFQDKGAYGRILHLQPVTWKDGWPVMGINDRNYCGEPVLSYKKPKAGKTFPVETPVESDEFDSSRLGLQWQWHANPGQAWGLPSTNGYLRMYGQYYPESYVNMWDVPNLLLQKFTAPAFTATAKISAVLQNEGDKAGFIVMGRDYSSIALVKKDAGYVLEQTICRDAEQKNPERKTAEIPLQNLHIDKRLNYQTPIDKVLFYYRLTVEEGALCTFSYSVDGKEFYPFGEPFQARHGKWIGAKMGLFILNKTAGTSRSWVDILTWQAWR
jgi:beta-xylosidase